jgi:ParB family chromosome partitioning protein
LPELAESIRRHGLLQPVVLIGRYGHPPYQLIAGQRRFLAHRKLGKATIRAVFESNVDDEKATLLSLIENLQRLDVNHADAAKAITSLYLLYHGDERRVQRETGLSLRRIRDYITVEAQASPKMKRQLRNKKATPADIKRALRAASGQLKKAEEILDLMSTLPMTRHQKQRVVEQGQTHRRASARQIIEAAMRPRVEQSVLVSVSERIRLGLEQATRVMEREPEEIIAAVLDDWIQLQGLNSTENIG